MRMKLFFELDNCNLDLDYRRMLLSFIKKSLEENDRELYEEMYNENVKTKRFTFSVQLHQVKYNENLVLLSIPKFEVRISSSDYAIFVRLYNVLLKMKNVYFQIKHKNKLKLKKIILENELLINSDAINICFASPLVVREHIREINKDYYYIFSDEKFFVCLKNVIKNLLKENELLTSKVDELEIKPISGKFVLVKTFGLRIPASLGCFKLKGDRTLLKYLFDNGMGSRRGVGFGMFDLK